MNIRFQSKTLLLYLIFILSVFQITSCKKDTPPTERRAAPPPPLSSPQLAFWTDEGSICLCNGDSIYISVNNTTQILDKYYYGTRVTTCNDDNAIRFSLMPGTYSWQAVRRSDTLRGSVIINANSCFLQEIKF